MIEKPIDIATEKATKEDDNLPPIAFMTDAPPLVQGGYGCHVLSYNLISVLKPAVSAVITRRMQKEITYKEVKDCVGVPTFFYPDLSAIPSKKIIAGIKSVVETTLACLWSKRICKKISESGAKRIFACCGADPYFLLVIDSFRKNSNLPIDVYLVDDFASSAILNGYPELAEKISRWERQVLTKVDRVFTISKGFAEHLKEKHNINCRWLPIPILVPDNKLRYHKPTSFKDGVKTITYFGAVNPLYSGGIKTLLKEISSFNSQNSTNKFRLLIMTYTEPAVVIRELGEQVDYEILHKAEINQCRKIMMESAAIFLPYTFENPHQVMVATSFPSRFAETLPIGRPLLVYGPSYASLPRHFKENNLQICVTEESGLGRALKTIKQFDNPNTIEAYEQNLIRYHSPQSIKNILKLKQ